MDKKITVYEELKTIADIYFYIKDENCYIEKEDGKYEKIKGKNINLDHRYFYIKKVYSLSHYLDNVNPTEIMEYMMDTNKDFSINFIKNP